MKALIFLSPSVCGPQTIRIHLRFCHFEEGGYIFTEKKVVGFPVSE